MQNPGYNTGNTIFTEGEWYSFRIHNLVLLQDDAWYYVLQDGNGLKHFMTAEFYMDYGFQLGDEIVCKIDRINCTGRIFLEPQHPHFKEGEVYYFNLQNHANPAVEKSSGANEILENTIEVPVNSISMVDKIGGKKVRCIVRSIKKGKLILEIHPD